MADLRLSGAPLKVFRSLASSGLTSSTVWAAVSKDFHIAELMALPASDRTFLDDSTRPVQGRPPRQWDDAGLAAPDRTDGSTVSAIRAAYQAGTADPVSVLERALTRSKAGPFGPATYSPFAALDEGPARAAAEESARRLHDGRARSGLEGVPVVVKDEVHMVGLDTLGGTSYLRGKPATTDAWVVQRLRDAGAVIYGKTHCPEWGMNPLGFSDFYEFPRNPYRDDRGAGGSSTGTGVAVALGLAPVGLGSDGGGSIRIPSAHSGVFGLKPTYVRMSRVGDTWGRGSMPHLGPIGRSTADLVEFLAVTAGVDPEDPTTSMQPDVPIEAWRRALGRGVRGARIGVPRSEWKDCDPGLAGPAMAALEALAREGAVLVDVDIPLAAHASAIGALVITSETTASLTDDYAAYGDQFGEEMRVIYALLGNIKARELLVAARTRAALRRQVAAVFQGVDLLALPTLARPPIAYPLSDTKRPVMETSATAGITRYSFMGNLTGLPACSIPVGMHDGMPVGLQLMGDAWDEASVLAAMAHAERAGLTQIPAPPGFASLLG